MAKKETRVKKEKKPSKVITAVKNTGKKVKDGVAKGVGAVKTKAKDYADAVKIAYETGYRAGYRDSSEIADKPGTRLAAKTGYSNGVKDCKTVKKINEKVKKRKVMPSRA